ncbi:SDR family NAD(P)-dependent oxidoreductase [Sphingobium sp. EM0848]|uniref:SDR family NAD(P)-dependent oxidoreductase n=1 Tax=Sphingobium sp. EM0848 TaxID=2743473 RepID=UPI00159CA3D0|nr:SDR family NAD(P)-dependent oxidoreductase [Sphingobium sp. EM0848]
MTDRKAALVLGATGGIGGETAAALIRHGWRVVAMARNPVRPATKGTAPLAGVRWVQGDAMNAGDVRRAAEGVELIVHAVNPPGYRGWGRLVLPMIDNSIAAARAARARIVLPGTIYNYGADAFPDLREDSPQHAPTEKGRIRVELEHRLEEASRAGVPVLIVRFGDFFGPMPGNNWFSQGLVTPGRRIGAITRPGPKDIGHGWAYLPDAAETIARLLDRSNELEPFARFHFGGTWDADGKAMIHAITHALERPTMKVRALPWPLIGLAGLFNETARELYRMRYLWREPIRLDNRKLVAFLGEEPHTPLEEAVRTTLFHLGIS